MFALDISGNRIRIVELLKKRGEFLLNGIGEKEFSSQETLPQCIKELARTTKPYPVLSHQVAVAIPEEESFVKIFGAAKKDPRPLYQTVKEKITTVLPYTEEEVYWDWKVAGGGEEIGTVDIIVAASPKIVVDEYIQIIKRSGFEPGLIETEANALAWGVLGFSGKESGKPLLILGLGLTKITAVIIANGIIYFTTSIQFEEIINQPMEKKGKRAIVTEESLRSLALKIKEYIAYYQAHITLRGDDKSNSIEKIIICGDWADSPEIFGLLRETLLLPIEKPNLIIKINPAYTTALGLAIRGIYEEGYAEI